MMIKYYHPAGVLEDGKIYCTYCETELDEELFGDIPCSIQTANRLYFDRYIFEISVWNCRAELLVFTEDKNGRRKYHSLEASEDTMDKIEELVLDSIHESGGAINISGLYPLSEKLVKFLKDSLESGKFRIVES